ncbi:flagellar hook-basal body complex protein FliE [Rhizobium sp. RU20A]|uniref:flagellar hook-basal body complex protein FliE n=1 Tax=Rhizobium sp. RU20A TaxID=1907412 RepID=UPI000955702C|nr:flagellar hook-basal body complex protein FliE [Rhizobium sp. RU20A]SIQ56022.1 flagellar hook-basal body complex protein FliE [Rhizobium sp. RU20A]
MIDSISSIGALGATRITDGAAEANALLQPGMAQSSAATGTGQSFASMLGNMATDTINQLKSAETASIQGIRGEANTREVVDAVMSAEQSLQTAMAIRDKLVTAYLDITRMPI